MAPASRLRASRVRPAARGRAGCSAGAPTPPPGSPGRSRRRSAVHEPPHGPGRSSASISGVTVARKSVTCCWRSARTSRISSCDSGSRKTDMSKPISAAPVNCWPIGCHGCSIRWIPRPSQASVARTRCRRVWASDHSSSTWASHLLAGCAVDRLLPRGAYGVPALAKSLGRLRLLELASGELAVQLGVDVGHHVDAVDDEAAEEEVVAVDVEAVEVHAAHRHAADVGEPHLRALEAGLHEGRALELFRV